MEAPPKHPQTAAMFAALLKALDVSASKLAVNISTEDEKYKQQTIANYVSGRFKPGQELLAAIKRRYPAISTDWLVTGEGEMFPAGRYNEKPAAPTDTEPKPPGLDAPALVAETNPDIYFHRYHALLDMVNSGFFGSPEQLLKKGKKARASAHAADLYTTVEIIASEKPATYVAPGFKQQGVHRQLAS